MKYLLILFILFVGLEAQIQKHHLSVVEKRVAGVDWTPSTIEIYEGNTDLVIANYKVLIYNAVGNLLTTSNPLAYSRANAYVSLSVASTSDISASSTYYYGVVLEPGSGSAAFHYPSGASTWQTDDDGGSYASPAATITYGSCSGDYEYYIGMVRVKNASGEILLEWGGTSGGEQTITLRDITLSYCPSGTSESSPQ